MNYALNPKLELKVRDNPFQSKLLSPKNSDELFLILAFSGGGTMAAALALPAEQVDKLRDVAGKLLCSHESFNNNKLVKDLGGKMPGTGQER